MPTTRQPLTRLVALVTLLLHCLVVGLAPLADARAEVAAVAVTPHVEAPGDTGCPPVHDHLACALCRVLDHTVGDLPPAHPLAPEIRAAVPVTCEAPEALPGGGGAPQRARAPPVA